MRSLGIASFGPVDPDPRSETYGYITSTPKAGWRNTDISGMLGRALGVQVRFDTDVNAAALAESQWGSARGLDDVVYITVGTGIGGGAIAGGRLVHGLQHPEMGHMRLPHDRTRTRTRASVPTTAIAWKGWPPVRRSKSAGACRARELPPDHPAWRLEARYLAAGVVNMVCTLSPRRVIMGGGVMEQEQLFPMIREEVAAMLNGYVAAPEIGPPALGKDAGVLGAIALAMVG